MRLLHTLTLFLFASALVSCDYTMYVAVRNHQEACEVQVTYDTASAYFFDSDTLTLNFPARVDAKSSLLRINRSNDSYSFIAPRDCEVGLRPNALNRQPIKEVRINNAGTVSVFNLWDRKEFKRLKKSGRIKTRGFLLTTSLFIENI